MRAERGELGYQTNLNDLYHLVDEIGRGAFGVVSRVRHKASTRGFACKSIAKEQTPGIDDQKEQEHFDAIQREVSVMMTLRSCLNVAKLGEVFESESHVHIVQVPPPPLMSPILSALTCVLFFLVTCEVHVELCCETCTLAVIVHNDESFE